MLYITLAFIFSFFGIGYIVLYRFTTTPIYGVGGIFLLSISIALSFLSESFVFLGCLLFVALLPILLFLPFGVTRINRMKESLSFLNSYHNDPANRFLMEDLIGRKAYTLTELSPSGRIIIEEKEFLAFSCSGKIEKNQEVRVIGGEGASLIVVSDFIRE